METKKIMGTVLVAFGLLGLIPGVLGIFDKQEYFGINPWALALLGGLFFMSGIGLLKSIRSPAEV
ncbi:MAG: hypothetical protein IPM82_31245 [Saprospiraceae bacterium]|nr:hypothetical protein [Saprospiraceae bacterium]